MKIIELNIEDIKPYDNNPRNNELAVDKVAESIKQFGFKVPIVIDKNNVIVAGHTRYKASQQLGLEKIPCIKAEDLTDEQVKAYRLADNKVSEFATWDFEALENELRDINDINMTDFGFNNLENALDNWEGENTAYEFNDDEEKNYSITYEIAFNDEEEKEEWYDFIRALKAKYPELETIAERILIVVREWLNNE